MVQWLSLLPMQGPWVQSLSGELRSHMLQCGGKKKALEQDSGDLGTFFTRDKQALGLRMAVGMIGWIYKHKAEGVVWELADDSW